jgi:hypothetical protein
MSFRHKKRHAEAVQQTFDCAFPLRVGAPYLQQFTNKGQGVFRDFKTAAQLRALINVFPLDAGFSKP